jgi:hypothetical protein
VRGTIVWGLIKNLLRISRVSLINSNQERALIFRMYLLF